MSSKLEFVKKASRGRANIAALCREYGISRQTGYKLLKRYAEQGYDGLEERSRRPRETPLATAEDVVAAIVTLRQHHPRWGAKKLMVVLRRKLGKDTPSVRTVHRLLKRFGQVKRRGVKPQLSLVEHAPKVEVKAPNDLWTIDFKGWWRTRDGKRCDPLTLRDAYSKFVLALDLVDSATAEKVRAVMERIFRRYGLPKAIQSDNGSPFISSQSMAGLTTLSAWWASLGILVVRSRPAKPQDNGGHERMHADIAGDLETNPAASRASQQRACSRWRQVFNHVRPHEALGQRTPAEVYKPSRRLYGVRRVTYPLHWLKRSVGPGGSISVAGEEYFLSTALRGHVVALEPTQGMRYRAWLHSMPLGEVEIANLGPDQLQRLAG